MYQSLWHQAWSDQEISFVSEGDASVNMGAQGELKAA
jgi:hypothetical protein